MILHINHWHQAVILLGRDVMLPKDKLVTSEDEGTVLRKQQNIS